MGVSHRWSGDFEPNLACLRRTCPSRDRERREQSPCHGRLASNRESPSKTALRGWRSRRSRTGLSWVEPRLKPSRHGDSKSAGRDWRPKTRATRLEPAHQRLRVRRSPPENGRFSQHTGDDRERLNCLAGAGGFEPPNAGIKIRCLTTWLRPKTRQGASVSLSVRYSQRLHLLMAAC